MELLTVDVRCAADRVVVQLCGEADLTVVPLLTERLRETTGAGTPVEVDLSGVSFLDCACLSALIRFSADRLAAGRDCRLVGVPPLVRRMLVLTGCEGLIAGS